MAMATTWQLEELEAKVNYKTLHLYQYLKIRSDLHMSSNI